MCCSCGAPGFEVGLEDELAAELQHARSPVVGYLTVVATRGVASVDGIELRVVKGVEGFGAELEVSALRYVEGFVH